MARSLSIAILIVAAVYGWMGGWLMVAAVAGAAGVVGIAQSHWDMEPLLRLVVLLVSVLAMILLLYNFWTSSLPGISDVGPNEDSASRFLLYVEFLLAALLFGRSANAA